ncbi:hypothetical protein [Ruminococcus sp.]
MTITIDVEKYIQNISKNVAKVEWTDYLEENYTPIDRTGEAMVLAAIRIAMKKSGNMHKEISGKVRILLKMKGIPTYDFLAKALSRDFIKNVKSSGTTVNSIEILNQ